MRRISKSLSEIDSGESKQISMELVEKRSELQSVNEELASAIEKQKMLQNCLIESRILYRRSDYLHLR